MFFSLLFLLSSTTTMIYVSRKRILYTELQVCYPLLYFPFFKVAITEGSNGLGDFDHIQSNELGNPKFSLL
jgi:hypothetical protein